MEINPDDYFGSISWLIIIFMLRSEGKDSLLAEMERIYPYEKLEYTTAFQYALAGQKDKALESFNSNSWYLQILMYSLLNMKDKVINLLEEKTERRYKKRNYSRYLFFKNFPYFKNFRSDLRFQKIFEVHKKIYEENLKKYGDIDI